MTITETEPTTAERVAAGCAFLDKECPDWWTRVDLDHLDTCTIMADIPSYAFDQDPDVMGYYIIFERWAYKSYDWMMAHGFDPVIGTEEEYDELDAMWRQAVIERRGKGTVAPPEGVSNACWLYSHNDCEHRHSCRCECHGRVRW